MNQAEPRARSANARWFEVLCVLAGAVLFVAIVDRVTGQMEPAWDGLSYFRLAGYGFEGRLVAPYVYRPAMPLLVGWLADAAGLTIEDSFRQVGRVAAGAQLALAYALARSAGRARPALATFVALCVGLSYYHVRFPLFFWSLVDVAAYPLLLLSFLWLWRGQIWRAGLLAGPALLFKEFLALPWLIALVEGGVRAWRRRSGRDAALTALVLALGACAYLLPRRLLEVDESVQWVDPLADPDLWLKLEAIVTSAPHLLAVVLALIAYWMPTLLLSTPARWRAARELLGPHRRSLVLYLALLLPLVLFGGSNVQIFASYAVAAQVLVLAALLSARPPALWEAALVLLSLFAIHQWFTPIPDANLDLDAYAGFHHIRWRFGTGYPLAHNLFRLVELGAWLGAMIVLRAIHSRLRRALRRA